MARARLGAGNPDSVMVAFRFPRALVKAIDEHAKLMKSRDRHLMTVSRSDAARELIALGLRTV